MSFLYSWFYPPNEAPVMVAPSPLELKEALDKLSKIPIEKNRRKYLTPLAAEFQQRLDSGRYHKWDAEASKSLSTMHRVFREKADAEDVPLEDILQQHKSNLNWLHDVRTKTVFS